MRTWIALERIAAAPPGGGEDVVLQGIDFRVGAGEFVAVVGVNGSGKSTLLRVLAGLLPVAEGKAATHPEADGAVRIVFQNPDAQLIGETVYEEIAFGLEQLGVPTEEMPERVRLALRSVGLDVPASTPVERLSGGQKQLLGIAGALAAEARVLLLDEPTSMLDPVSKASVVDTVRALRDRGLAVVWSTQAMDEVGLADRIVALQDGRVAFEGTPETFFYGEAGKGDDAHGANDGGVPCVALGLRLPYAVETAHRLRDHGVRLTVRPVTDDQLLEAVAGLCR
ncbi:ATP-binding cassette domain-containing protein [Paenibacillus flagellatus]|uniref:ATP-binding cassette domain-containing protein n=1 Tax=Paenibacillus flagellatus TaxID=2211139 RepID=UPI0013053075|nr:ATP-binding cassette domain-containing protein [Paenibacillus flagellatus]